MVASSPGPTRKIGKGVHQFACTECIIFCSLDGPYRPRIMVRYDVSNHLRLIALICSQATCSTKKECHGGCGLKTRLSNPMLTFDVTLEACQYLFSSSTSSPHISCIHFWELLSIKSKTNWLKTVLQHQFYVSQIDIHFLHNRNEIGTSSIFLSGALIYRTYGNYQGVSLSLVSATCSPKKYFSLNSLPSCLSPRYSTALMMADQVGGGSTLFSHTSNIPRRHM